MYQSLHMEIAKASAPRPRLVRGYRSETGRGSPPKRRVRGQAARVLVLLAQRLDEERARRVLA